MFEVEVKYIGDDMTLQVFDEDPGKDDKVIQLILILGW
jgi:hypothetical protein